MLLERTDANPNSPDKSGWTPLSFAAHCGQAGVAKMLLGRGDANLNSRDNDGRTPLPYAAGSGREGVAKMLLERGGVDPDSLDNAGRTPLSYAARSRNEGVTKILLERSGINLDSSQSDGLTLLSLVALSNPNDIMSPPLESRPFSHEISPTIQQTQQSSVPTMSAPVGPISQPEGIISDTRHDVTEVIPFPHSDRPPPGQLEAPPAASALTPIPRSDTAPHLALSQTSRSQKRHTETPPLLYPSKRLNFPLS